MTNYTQIDTGSTPATVCVPRQYNAANDFLDRQVARGRGEHTAIIDGSGAHSYYALAERANRAGNALHGLGVEMETRVMLCLLDTVDFPALFWGAIKIGSVPIPINTLLTTKDYDYMLRDSRARVLVVSAAILEKFAPILDAQPFLQHVVVVGKNGSGHTLFEDLLITASPELEPAPTNADDIAFWLYTSGSTGTPKGAMHLHSDLVQTAVLYGLGVLGIRADDVVFSAAKMFFAYGLGNTMTFPFYIGATAVLLADRPTPESVMAVLREHEPTIHCGVPTLYGAILADPGHNRETGSRRLRLCISAGEALPREVGALWEERFGCEILDGLGSTEMLHIFLSNRGGEVRYGTSGKAVPGYRLRVVDENGEIVKTGEMGELEVSGPSSAVAYWNQRQKSMHTFCGAWTRTGDKYIIDDDGYFLYCGRTDDMLKVSGQWVSPFEVESALLAHDQVLEVAVVGQADDNELIKPKGFVVLKDPAQASPALATELQQFVKGRLAPFKYPRWVEFTEDLPKTATGKIQRFKLRS